MYYGLYYFNNYLLYGEDLVININLTSIVKICSYNILDTKHFY